VELDDTLDENEHYNNDNRGPVSLDLNGNFAQEEQVEEQ